MTRPANANSFLSKAYKARRTALYVPAANSRALEKARTMDADVVILDLEDAVAAEDKARARETAAAMLKSFAPREVVVRVNSAGTIWHDADMAAMAQAQPHAILLDLRSPLAIGLQFLRAVRALPGLGETPVAIVTGDYYVDDAHAQEIAALGAELRYKPLWLDELVSLARGLVGPLATT